MRVPSTCVPRVKLADEREGITHHFSIQSAEGEKSFYILCGLYEDKKLGEIFIIAGKEGSLISAALDGLSTMMSIGLQHGVPLENYTKKLRHTQFEPSGYVPQAPKELSLGGPFLAKSPFDYIAAWLNYRFTEGFLNRRPTYEDES